jgi:integrase
MSRSGGGRRGKGEGSVFYEEDRVRWVGVLDLGRSVNGRRVRRKVTGASAKEVRERLRQLREDVEGGASALDGNVTVDVFLTDWLEREVPKFAGSVNTKDNYRWAVMGHLVPGLGHIRLARLTADDVDALLEDRAASGRLARSSVARLRTVLGTALDHAARRNLVRRNVARLTNVPPGSSTSRRSLSADDARKLLGAVREDRLRALVVTGVALGLRPGELLGLSWRDVDLDAGVVHLRQQLKREDNRPVLGELKTARSRRSLRCPPVVVDALRERRALQDEERAAAGASWSAEWAVEALVFTTTNGRPVDASNLRRYFRAACKAAGIGRWTPYEMRHSAASLMSAAGVPLEHVADVLGHNGTRMAALVYRHVLAPTVEAGAAPMQALFGEPEEAIGSPDGSPEPDDLASGAHDDA